MIKQREIVVRNFAIDKVYCNKCGREVDYFDQPPKYEIIDLTHTFGYMSSKDMETWSAHICEDCYDEFVKTFKIAPEITGGAVDDLG